MKFLRKMAGALMAALFILILLLNLWGIASTVLLKRPLPEVFGYSYLAVLTGSMEPAVSAGDLIVIYRQTDYHVGDIITFLENGIFTTHRISAAGPNGYQTKGDANSAADSDLVPPEQIMGRVVWVFPGVGNALLFLRTPPGLACLLLLGALALFLAGRSKSEGKRCSE